MIAPTNDAFENSRQFFDLTSLHSILDGRNGPGHLRRGGAGKMLRRDPRLEDHLVEH
jgi:hypothetical protein